MIFVARYSGPYVGCAMFDWKVAFQADSTWLSCIQVRAFKGPTDLTAVLSDDHSLLQVVLAVDIGRFDEAEAVGVRRVQEEEVGGDDAIAQHADNVPHL